MRRAPRLVPLGGFRVPGGFRRVVTMCPVRSAGWVGESENETKSDFFVGPGLKSECFCLYQLFRGTSAAKGVIILFFFNLHF